MIYKPMSSLVQIGFIEPRLMYHIAFLFMMMMLNIETIMLRQSMWTNATL